MMPLEEIERRLAIDFEGKLFVHVWLMKTFATYMVCKDYYTVFNGKACSIHGGELDPTGDTMMKLQTDCRRVGVYNPLKTYKSITKNYSYSEIKKLLKL